MARTATLMILCTECNYLHRKAPGEIQPGDSLWNLGSPAGAALVAGSSSGIGASIAVALAAEGARVVIHGRDKTACRIGRRDHPKAAGEAAIVCGDLGDPAAVDGRRSRRPRRIWRHRHPGEQRGRLGPLRFVARHLREHVGEAISVEHAIRRAADSTDGAGDAQQRLGPHHQHQQCRGLSAQPVRAGLHGRKGRIAGGLAGSRRRARRRGYHRQHGVCRHDTDHAIRKM